MKDVIVVGGGASGLISAIYATKSGSNVTILEKNSICGKKILITGNGKCNYWNEDQSINHYHSSTPHELPNIITEKNTKEILLFFHKLGIIPKIKDGYYYPYSNQATSIETALVKEAQVRGVNIITEEEVIDLKKESNIFKIITKKAVYTADKVIISTGSYSQPKTGSDGFGYKIAKKLNHTIIHPLPALVQLKADTNYLKEWHGIRSDVEVSLIENNKLISSQVGEIQLTNTGVSGICIFCLSGKASRGLYEGKKEQIKINFLHPFHINNVNEFIIWMDNRNKLMSKRILTDLLDGILNYKLTNLILKICKIDRESSWNNLSESDKKNLGSHLIGFTLDITGTNNFDSSQTTTGGVPLTEINTSTMESKIIKNLYFTGELLDVDGDCGGYNLGFAWITGMLAGSSIGRNLYD